LRTKVHRLLLASLALGCAVWACPATADTSAPAIGTWGFDLSAMDRSVSPGDDFNRYANGGWIARTPVPADRSRWGALDRLLAKSESDLREIVEGIASDPAPSAQARKVADYYHAYLDTNAIEAKRLQPIAAELKGITALASHAAVARFMGLPEHPYGGPIAWFPFVDPKDPGHYAIQVGQSGLGLPDRDFYLDPGASFAATREK
jgi:putative endopeptidase